MKNIAIIGTGNVGGTLAKRWAQVGHIIHLGVRDLGQFKGQHLIDHPNIKAHLIPEAVALSEVLLLAVPALQTIPVVKSLGDTANKIVIDAMNIIGKNGPSGYSNTSLAILDHTQTKDVVKAFNTIGFNIMDNPSFQGTGVDAFTAGDSTKGKEIVRALAKDLGFENCYDVGGNDKFDLMEQFALFWINLAIFQGQGREVAFKLLRR